MQHNVAHPRVSESPGRDSALGRGSCRAASSVCSSLRAMLNGTACDSAYCSRRAYISLVRCVVRWATRSFVALVDVDGWRRLRECEFYTADATLATACCRGRGALSHSIGNNNAHRYAG